MIKRMSFTIRLCMTVQVTGNKRYRRND
ncbi:MAG TPA: hypothetical protein DCP92_22840 [Nitrospiraceae bacterium]|nr:hypothetical protein [Nitrospiraceae bacterium]